MDDCILWEKAISKNGYGASFYQGKQIGAHRLAWIKANGPIPKGLLVCHTCDTRHCINVTHLFLGTVQDNMKDKVRKGRANYNRETKTVDGMRPCSFCKEVKPVSQFSPSHKNSIGNVIFNARCKECTNRGRRVRV